MPDSQPPFAGSLVIPSRFRGPRRSANGGYTAGLLASYVRSGAEPTVEVTLRRPPPLDETLTLTPQNADVQLRAGGEVVAEAAPGTLDELVVPPVPYAAALKAEESYGGLARHPFPGCFACGTDRVPGDALCLRPGVLADGRTACTWIPRDDQARLEIVWAALDCPGGWAADVAGRPIVLGRITAHVRTVPHLGQRCVVMGQLLQEQGRKVHTASAMYDEDGQLLARARHVWLTVDPSAFE
ncbi:hypothetical protein [Actinopolymorpha alba]|uniref:hypothetical protein n=1 Tax=Actinopolymorpha alba TaxID=533267 RepID=UPI000380B1E3|nr:hypothetical protein [Actinopolymorpha alba]